MDNLTARWGLPNMFLAILLCLAGRTASCEENSAAHRFAIAIHGGCGNATRLLPQDVQEDYLAGLRTALELGKRLLVRGHTSIDVVEQVARALEDDGRFNAGKGSIFNKEGRHELDASIMDGRTMACGAVAGVRTVKNPVTLARLVMDRITVRWSMTFAMWGRFSAISMPGTLVEMAFVSPPFSWLGLGLKVSNWLGPPAIQSTMQAIPSRRSCSDEAAMASVGGNHPACGLSD